MIIEDIKPTGLSIPSSRNVTFGTKLYNTDTFYNKDQAYFGAASPGIYPTMLSIEQFKPSIVDVGVEDTYYSIIKQGQPIGLLLAITQPTTIKIAI